SSVAKTPVVMRARNADGEYGPTVSLEVSRYDTVGSGPSLNVVATPGALTYTVSYTSSTAITYTVNGSTTSLPSSPFLVSRPAAGATPTMLGFSVTANGQTVTETVE